MAYNLVVTSPFGSYEVGDHITTKEEALAALESNPSSVVRISIPDATTSAPVAAPDTTSGTTPAATASTATGTPAAVTVAGGAS